MEETKVIYYIDDEETPYLMKIAKQPEKVTLGDFKGQLNRTYIKFFFKSEDDDFGVVKEELAEDEALLPHSNGRVVCWVVTESNVSGSEAGGSKGDAESVRGGKEADGISIISGTSKVSSRRHHHHRHRHSNSGRHHHRSHRHRGPNSTVSGTDIETATDITTETETSCYETEDTMSRVSSSTLTSLRPRKKVLTKHRPKLPRSVSTSTITTNTMTDLSTTQILKVTLNMDTVNFLGISIVGQTNEEGAGGIYVGSVMKGGAVAADGRIEPGDMLLEVNDICFENMSNDDAVRTLREIVQHPGPITLTVAKCWEPEPIVPNFEPRLEPIRPIDPSAWVMQTNQHQGDYQYGRQFAGSPTLSTMTSNSSPSLTSSIPESERDLVKLTLTTPMYRIAKALATPNSGLEVKDRVWLKMTIPNSFIGSDLVDWLNTNVEGFIDRRHARKYAALMLKHGFLKHTVNKITFSEQCYYIFGDFRAAANSLPSEFSQLALSNDSGEGDTLGPLPGQPGWGSSDGEFSVAYEYYQHKQSGQMSTSSKSSSPSPENKHQMYGSSRGGSSGSSSASASNSQHSRQPRPSSGNSNSNNRGNMAIHPYNPHIRRSPSISSSSEFTSVSQQPMPAPPPPVANPHLQPGTDIEPDRISIRSDRIGNLGVAAHLANSRESFQQALDNPCEYFIDVM